MDLFKSNIGKLLVYGSLSSYYEQRLQSVKNATEKVAKLYNLNFEFINVRKGHSQIYVYYQNGGDEAIPIYCDGGKTGDSEQITTYLRNMMFVLSFHSGNTTLKQVRNDLIRLS